MYTVFIFSQDANTFFHVYFFSRMPTCCSLVVFWSPSQSKNGTYISVLLFVFYFWWDQSHCGLFNWCIFISIYGTVVLVFCFSYVMFERFQHLVSPMIWGLGMLWPEMAGNESFKVTHGQLTFDPWPVDLWPMASWPLTRGQLTFDSWPMWPYIFSKSLSHVRANVE